MANLMIFNQFLRLSILFQSKEFQRYLRGLKLSKSRMEVLSRQETLCKSRDPDPNQEELVPNQEETRAKSLKIEQLQQSRRYHLPQSQAPQVTSGLNSFLRPREHKPPLTLNIKRA